MRDCNYTDRSIANTIAASDDILLRRLNYTKLKVLMKNNKKNYQKRENAAKPSDLSCELNETKVVEVGVGKLQLYFVSM